MRWESSKVYSPSIETDIETDIDVTDQTFKNARWLDDMLLPTEFLERWDQSIYGLVDFDSATINSFLLPKEAKDFLIEAGLPESAAPYLNFQSSKTGGVIKLSKKYQNDSSCEKYILIGCTGSGDDVCIVENIGKIVCVDHENLPHEVFINSSLPQFTEFLLIYSEFVKKIKEVNGKRAFLERDAPKYLIRWVIEKFNEIDEDALREGNFWNQEISDYANLEEG